MIDFDAISDEELEQFKQLILKNVERSELEKYYLFTDNVIEKGTIFLWCFRFLVNVTNLLEKDSNLKKIIDAEVKLAHPKFHALLNCLDNHNRRIFNQHRFRHRIWDIINEDTVVNDLIDAFTVLSERGNILQISRIKGFVLEGKSGQEYNKIFKSDQNKPQLPQEKTEDEMEMLLPASADEPEN